MADPAQFMPALDKANAVRLARAEFKRKVATGDLGAADVIAAPPPEAESMTVFALLMAQRQWGRQRTLTVLARVRVSEFATVGALTDRQRAELIRLLP